MTQDEHSLTQNVLVIDDDQIIRSLVRYAVTQAGFGIIDAEDGERGLALFAARPADIILLDVMMPGIDGFTVCEKIRATASGQHVPILMMTGSDSAQAVERAFGAGATDFATKPLNLKLLVHRIRYILRAKHTADQLRERERSLLDAQRIAGLGDWAFDLRHDRFNCSDIVGEILALDENSISRDQFLNSVQRVDRARVDYSFRRIFDIGSPGRIEFGWVRPDNQKIDLSLTAKAVNQDDDQLDVRVGAIQDITERREAERKIRALAYYDGVTGLPNRTLFQEQLGQAAAIAVRQREALAVLFVDLDHFKRINDTWGHPTGDEVLQIAAERIKHCLRASDVLASAGQLTSPPVDALKRVVARIGGDEFVILLPKLRRVEDAAIVASRINVAMARPFSVQGTQVYISCSIGISLCPDDSRDVDSLLKQADGAMYEAKNAGRNCYHFYTDQIQRRAFQRLSMEARLRRALEHQEFMLHYQPKLDMKTGVISGIEALVRWQDPDIGLISPADFIPLAEETGLIMPLGHWVLETACAQAQELQANTAQAICVSVNLSALQLKNGNLVQAVQKTLSSTGLAPSMLELELTESLLIDEAETQLKLLHKLKSVGVQLSIDDFGTGYSSLSYLKRFPIDSLKIDRSFIRDLVSDPDDAAIVRAAISLAHNLRLCVVAEGVETQEQHDLLRRYGCDIVQGFLHCKPLSPDDLAAWIKSRQPLELNGMLSHHSIGRQ